MNTKRRWYPKKSAWAAAKAEEFRAKAAAVSYNPLQGDPAKNGPIARKLRSSYALDALRYDALAERFRAAGQ